MAGAHYLTDSIVALMRTNKRRAAAKGETPTILDLGRLTRSMESQLKVNEIDGLVAVIAVSRSAIALATMGGKYVKMMHSAGVTHEQSGSSEHRERDSYHSARKRKATQDSYHRRSR